MSGSTRVTLGAGGEPMTTPSDGLRRDAETTRLLGGRLVLVDAAAVIAKARRERVRAVPHRALPAAGAGRAASAWKRSVEGGRETIRMSADVRTGGFPPPHVIINSAVLGAAGPVSVLLARGLANGGPAAQRIAARRRAGRGRAHQAAAHVLAAGRRLGGVGRPARRRRRRRPARHDLLQRRARRQGQPRRAARRRRQPRRVDPGRRPRLRDDARPTCARWSCWCCAWSASWPAATEPLRGRTYVVSLGGGVPRAASADRSDDVTLDQVGGLAERRRRSSARSRSSFRHPEVDGPVGRPPAAGHPDVRPARHRQDHAGPGAGQRDRRRLPRDPHAGDPRQVARRLGAQHQADLPGGPALPGADA